MPMTSVVTTNVAERFRGFLGSCMLEVASGVYVSPDMNKAVRERVWSVLEAWHGHFGGTICMTWPDKGSPSGVGIKMLGQPPREICDLDGVYVSRLRTSEGCNELKKRHAKNMTFSF